MIGRYSLPAMATIWSDTHRLEMWHKVELLALEGWAKLGVAPLAAVEGLRETQVPSPEEVAEREQVTDHDLAAFVDLLGEKVPTGGEWIHFGLTSSDVLDTAGGFVLAEAARLLCDGIGQLFEIARRMSLAERDTPILGRTHGIWAEPTSFGLKVASWAFELARDHERMVSATEAVAVGKISGAVGTYAHTPSEIEDYVCQSLGLSPEPASTQVTARDRHAQYLGTIALTGATLERIATEIRHLQRSEVGEVREPFRRGQKGSSAMPHKRNPVISERITGMARLLRGYASSGLENVALWHERDISHSSAERVAVPDASLLLHYMLEKMKDLLEGLIIDRERMKANLERTGGLVYSQKVLLALVESGVGRDKAYRVVQENAMHSWDRGSDFQQALADDPRVTLSPEVLGECFRPEAFLTNSDVVFERLAAVSLSDPRTG
ncbi:MAG TPA: adenylosuccinate lyase [Acidimicrobiia bacterium]|nr:adenylosuccinate lyase [Acidimicrobiia bacterium]